MPPRRLLHVLESTTGGVRRYVTSLVRDHSAEWEVAVACPAIRQTHFGDMGFVDDMQRHGIPVHCLPLRRSIGAADVSAVRALYALVHRQHFDLIHTHSSKAGFIGRLVARLAGIPVIHTPNGLYFLEQSGAKRAFYLMLEQIAGRWTDELIAVSESERAIMFEFGLASRQRIHLVENGIDIARVRTEAAGDAMRLRYTLGVDCHGPLIGSVGRLAHQKDPLMFVRAAQLVLQSISTARFVWVGDGELRDAARNLAHRLNVPLLLPGHREGLPFTLLEAMALNVPVVATNVIGVRDVLRDESTGLLAPAGDEGALACAIVDSLMHSEETHRRVKAAQKLVETRFALDHMLEAHRALYTQTANARSARLVTT